MEGSPSGKKNSLVRRILRIAFKTALILLLVILVLIFLVQTSFVQDFARKKIRTYLQSKLNSRVEIGNLYIGFPEKIVIEHLYLEDQHRDTLLNAGRIEVNISMLGLLQHKIDLSLINLEDITVKIKRQMPDSAFNYEFILKAFAGNQEPRPQKTDTSTFKFSIGKVKLHKIAATYFDDATGNDAYLSFNDFETHIETFDPNHMIFTVPDLSLSAVRSRFRQFRPSLVIHQAVDTLSAENRQSNPISLNLGHFSFTDIRADYSNEISATRANIRLGSLQAFFRRIDLGRLYFGLDKIVLDSSSIQVAMRATPNKKPGRETVVKDVQHSNDFQIELGDLSLTDNDFQYDDTGARFSKEGIDYNHLKLQRLTASVQSIGISRDQYKAKLESLSVSEQSGFQIRELSGGILYGPQSAGLSQFVLKTGNSTIRTNSVIDYLSTAEISKRPGNLKLALNFEQGSIGIKDVFLLVPSLKKQLSLSEAQNINVTGQVNGQLSDLTLKQLDISGLEQTKLAVSGHVKGLPDFKKAIFDLDIKNLSSNRKDISSLLPVNTLPGSVRIPKSLALSGNFHGSMDRFKTLLHLKSSNGNVDLKGSLATRNKTYDFIISSQSLDLGYLLKQDSLLGRFTLKADIRGEGFDYKTMHSILHADFSEAEIKGYKYHNIETSDSLQNGRGEFHLVLKDPQLSMNLDAAALLNNKYPDLKMRMQLDTANLNALNLSKDSLGLKWILEANFPSTNPDSLQGRLKWYDIAIMRNGTLLTTDSVLITADHPDSNENIALHSEIADFSWQGKYRITELPQAMSAFVNRYYRLNSYHEKKISAQDWQMRATLKPAPLLFQLMPSLKGSDSVSLQMDFNSTDRKMLVAMNAAKLQFGSFPVSNLLFAINSGDTSLNYGLNISEAGGQGFRLNQTSLQGYVANNKLFSSLIFKDRNAKKKYQLAGWLEQKGRGISYKLDSDSLLLNYDKWILTPDNFVDYDSTGLIVHNLEINRDQQSFAVNSESPIPTSPIDIRFQKFRIKTLTSFAEQDSLLADGLVDGSMQIKNALHSPLFTSDLKIKNLTYKEDTVGNLSIKVNNEEQNQYKADVELEGHDNDLKIIGSYNTGNDKMDLALNIGQLNLASVKPFAGASINDIKGFLKGNLKASGSLSKPVLNGNIHFEQAYIVPAISGEKLRLPNDPIAFDNDGVNFSSFTLLDSAGNKAVLDGNIYTADYKKYRFDLSFNANNFRLVNAQRSVNSLFFGKLDLDAGINVTGDLESPKINADIRVNKATDFTLILPSNNPELIDREGVVVFVDKDHPTDTVKLKTFLDSLSRNSELKGMDVAATIETDSSAQFTMIIDERNGDALTVKGRADLVAGIDKSGKTTLTGNYELENGAYNLSLSVLKRKFVIQKGSTITWTGDPTKANIDITASYLVNTAPIDLVQQQLAGRTPADVNRFKTKLPFQVNLIMKGELLKPIITFEISLPQDQLALWPDVDAKLQQMKTDESEVNKQVFALLLLNRFVSENPFESAAGGTDAGSVAKQSASRILSDQLNQLAGSLIKGVDLNFDLNSGTDYSTGQAVNQTNLNVGVSKNLFSDRIRVTVGSNFALEGTNPNQNASNIAGDVNVDYRLSKDGRYMLRAYRKDQYESIVEGQVVETGLSFILTFDYDKFRELFESKKENHKPVKTKKENSPPNTELK